MYVSAHTVVLNDGMCCVWGKQVNISMVVDDAEAESLVIQLHKVFFPELESDGNKVIVKGILQWNLKKIWLLVSALCCLIKKASDLFHMVQGCLFYFDHELNRVCFPWNFCKMKRVARAVFAHKVSSLC
jgi:hypothetical protein